MSNSDIPTGVDLAALREIVSTVEGCSEGSEIYEMCTDAGGVGPVLCSLKRIEGMLEAAARATAEPVFGDWTGMRARVAVLEAQLEAERGVQDAIKQDGYSKVANAEKARLAAEAERDAGKAEIARLRGLIDRDRTGLAAGLSAIQKVVAGYAWLPAGEWGSYSYEEHTHETLRKEIGWAFDAVNEIASRHLRQSGDRADAAFRGGPGPAESVEVGSLVLLVTRHTEAVSAAGEEFARQLANLGQDFRRELAARARGKVSR